MIINMSDAELAAEIDVLYGRLRDLEPGALPPSRGRRTGRARGDVEEKSEYRIALLRRLRFLEEEDGVRLRRRLAAAGPLRVGEVDDAIREANAVLGKKEGARVLIFGGGFLGKRLAAALSADLTTADICDRRQVNVALESWCPEIVVNAAGKTGRPNVDWCESNREETYRANVLGPLTLASACREMGAHLVHLGSGCIFYGSAPRDAPDKWNDPGWREDDHANPVAYYSKTKYAADLVLDGLSGVAVVRLRMPIDGVPHARNLITKLAGYARVIDVVNSVTVVDDFVKIVAGLIEKRAEGIFHAVNPGAVSHREILRLYREVVDPEHRCEFIDEAELVASGLAEKRRSNCVLADTKLAAMGLGMRPIDEALPDVMRKYVAARRCLEDGIC